MRSGRWVVVGIFALSAAMALFAVFYWKDPENRSRWSFTRFHSLLVRKHPEQAASFVAREVVFHGKTLSRKEFMAAYVLPKKSENVRTEPCPTADSHWTVSLGDLIYCLQLEDDLWKIGWLGKGPCRCSP